ncbi:MAG: hypothetical protein RRC34_06405 [Lentisphaeria bacterium]|nr:hypothetical protein [Lentisphaeria bacterium]
MHRNFRFFFSHALFAACLAVLSGCGKKAPPYDSLRGEILVDLANALDTNESAEIIKALDRLEPMTDVDEFVTRLREQEQTRVVIQQLNDCLGRADVKQARIFFNRASDTTNPAFREINEKITGLEALRDYLTGMPYTNAETMTEALESMRRRADTFRPVPAFRQWIGTQETALAQLRQKERQTALNRLLDACDQALDKRAVDADVAFARLLAFSSDTVAAKAHTTLRDGDPRPVLDLLKGNAPLSDLALKSLEICLLGNQRHLTPEAFNAVLAMFPQRPPQSLAGHVLAVIRMADEKKPAAALAGFRRYVEAGGNLPEQRLRALSATALLPPPHFNARPWRVTCPTVDHFLGIVTQWHDFHIGGTSEK